MSIAEQIIVEFDSDEKLRNLIDDKKQVEYHLLGHRAFKEVYKASVYSFDDDSCLIFFPYDRKPPDHHFDLRPATGQTVILIHTETDLDKIHERILHELEEDPEHAGRLTMQMERRSHDLSGVR